MVSWPGQQRKGCHHAQQCGAIVLTLLCSNRRNASFPVSCHAKKVRDVRHAYCGCRVDRISRSQRRNPARGALHCYTWGAKLLASKSSVPCQNAFGFGDILGRKVQTGLIQFIFFGRAPGGKAMIRRIDMDVLSTASTMSRTPASYQHKLGLRVTHGGRFLEDQVKSEVRLPAGRRSSESLQLKRPILSFRHAPFLADPSQTIPPPTGHLVSIHGIQPQSRFLGDDPP